MESLQRAYDIGKEVGLNYVYVGNILGRDLHSTYCPQCKAILIERDWTYTKFRNITNGSCNECGYKVEGMWE